MTRMPELLEQKFEKKNLFLQVVLIVLTLRISLCGITSITYVMPKAVGIVWGNGKAWGLAPTGLFSEPHSFTYQRSYEASQNLWTVTSSVK